MDPRVELYKSAFGGRQIGGVATSGNFMSLTDTRMAAALVML